MITLELDTDHKPGDMVWVLFENKILNVLLDKITVHVTEGYDDSNADKLEVKLNAYWCWIPANATKNKFTGSHESFIQVYKTKEEILATL